MHRTFRVHELLYYILYLIIRDGKNARVGQSELIAS